MLFTSLIFLLIFLPFVLLVYYVLLKKSRVAQNIFLMLASLFFYAWGEPWFVIILVLSITLNWFFGLLAAKRRGGRVLIALSVLFNLAILLVFKYLMFVLTNINIGFGVDLQVPNIALPIGISFFTFQAISYVVDVYRGNAVVQKNPLNVGLYISFFPQLIAGPIVRYSTIADQIWNRHESMEDFTAGIRRFIIGFAKKVFIANNVALVADSAFALTGAAENSVMFAWIGIIAYTLQIFFDFSGYSDMAIGLGRMFGFHFLENFNYPYIAKSTSEFWRRWHMSLGQWFRDYIYFPLGGSRVASKVRLVFNLFVVWFLTGLWHGANWTFLLWGLLYFVTITCEKLSGIEKAAWANTAIAIVFRHIYTMTFVMFGWVLFRATSITGAIAYLGSMFGMGGIAVTNDFAMGTLREYWIFFALGIAFSLPIAPKLGTWITTRFDEAREQRLAKASIGESAKPGGGVSVLGAVYAVCTSVLLIAVFAVCLSYLIKGSYNPFIYFNF